MSDHPRNVRVMSVRHADLVRIVGSDYKSECPTCGDGVLLMRREPLEGFRLVEIDNCLLCGQLFRYTDIAEVRERLG